MEEEIVEQRYPLLNAKTRALIQKARIPHRGDEAAAQNAMIDAVWAEHGDALLKGPGHAETAPDGGPLVTDEGGLTNAGRTAVLAYLDAAQQYEDEVYELDEADVVALYDEKVGPAEAARVESMRERGRRADVRAFFNRANARANYERWLSESAWTPEEATALSLAKDPHHVNCASLSRYKTVFGSPFKKQFEQRLGAIQRAIAIKDIKEPLKLYEFIAWAKDRRWDLPPALEISISKKVSLADKVEHSGEDGSVRLGTYHKIIMGLAINAGYDPRADAALPQPGVYSALMSLIHEEAAIDEKTWRKVVRKANEWADHHKPGLRNVAVRKATARAGAALRKPQPK